MCIARLTRVYTRTTTITNSSVTRTVFYAASVYFRHQLHGRFGWGRGVRPKRATTAFRRRPLCAYSINRPINRACTEVARAPHVARIDGPLFTRARPRV